jgi:hypothetical protein
VGLRGLILISILLPMIGAAQAQGPPDRLPDAVEDHRLPVLQQ